MNHYPHHIGDFNSATRHLTFVERALYRELLDLYYDTERPLNAEVSKLARRVLANTEELREALVVVLEEFFVLADDGWHNDRCDREIASFHSKQEQQSRAGRASAAKRTGGKPPDKGDAAPSNPEPEDGGGGADGGSTDVERALHGRSTNQNQNHINPPNPPAGGAVGGLAIATALSSHFPDHRRTRIAEVADLIEAIAAEGLATAEQLLQAAEQQADGLGRDGGKHAPNVLTWLRRKGWLDSAALPAGGGIPSDWSDTRSGIEAMGKRVGLPAWEASGYRLLADYETEVRRRLAAPQVPA
ncbi:MAG: YdaU family protein [Giesbergeria sp.]|jgi:uncharacterized protein YdaU (DUF1376 family)|nr:YdaU family protein [Giesbergeria sp.]